MANTNTRYEHEQRKVAEATTFIDQGAYGCVFRPAINCTGTDPDPSIPKISKVFKNLNAMDEELIYIERMRIIDPARNFTLQFFNTCSIEKADFGPAMHKCNFDYNTTEPIYQMVFEDGGDDLNLAVTKIQFPQIFKSLSSVFDGIETMVAKDFIHLDIKPQNMVYNSKDMKVAIIDFGVSATFEEFQLNPQICEPAYPYYPAEFTLLAKMRRGKQLSGKQNSSELYVHVSSLFDHILQGQHKQIIKEIRECNAIFLSQLHDTERTRQTLIGYVPDKIDVYALGASIMVMLARSVKHNTATIKDNEPFYKDVLRLCRSMMNMSHQKRASATQANTLYREIVRTHLFG